MFYLEKWKKNKNKWPSKRQWFSFFTVISKREKILFFLFLFSGILSLIFWHHFSYLENTELQPAEGGILKEAIVGQPQSLNPILSLLNDADRDISELTFAGLLNYDKNGNLVCDLCEKYEITDKGKGFEFTLKKNLLWSDNKKITANDVVFTIETIQNPEIQSPLKLVWKDVKVEAINERKVKFTLENPYPLFLKNFTFKIIPSHIFKETTPQEFPTILTERFVASGPFKIKNIEKDKENKIKKIILERNPNYYGNSPFLEGIEISFVKNKKELLGIREEETSLSGISAAEKEELKEEDFNFYSFALPRSFALFLNQQNELLSKKEIREALASATNKKEIVEKVLLGEGRIVDGPFLKENKIGGEIKKYEFNLEKAKKILENAGWKDTDNDNIRDKTINEKKLSLKFNLFLVKQPELKKTAEIIEKDWEKIGVKININPMEPQELLQEHIEKRNYDILLFGQDISIIPDPYPFWASSQKEYPGLNLSLYQNPEVDKILKNARTENDENKRKKLLQDFQLKLTEDIPAIFLYSPNYIYAVRKEIKGIEGKYINDISKRFIGIENWYINEKRVPKKSNQK